MSFVVRRGPPESAPRSIPAAERFPAKLCIIAGLAACGLYWYLVYVVPEGGGEEVSTVAVSAIEACKQAKGHPFLLAFALAAAFIPPLVFPATARKYFFRLALLLTLAWTCFFVVTMHPVAKAAEKVREALSAERNLPGPLKRIGSNG